MRNIGKKSPSGLVIDLVKIDVEGYSLSVLRGFGNVIKKAKVIQFEFGGPDIYTRIFFQDYWYFFSEHNFSIYSINPRDVEQISSYCESHEFFILTNFIAVKIFISEDEKITLQVLIDGKFIF